MKIPTVLLKYVQAVGSPRNLVSRLVRRPNSRSPCRGGCIAATERTERCPLVLYLAEIVRARARSIASRFSLIAYFDLSFYLCSFYYYSLRGFRCIICSCNHWFLASSDLIISFERIHGGTIATLRIILLRTRDTFLLAIGQSFFATHFAIENTFKAQIDAIIWTLRCYNSRRADVITRTFHL